MGTKARARQRSNPRICPNCDSDKVVPIVYGYPTEESYELEEQGKIALAGCCVVDGLSTKWYCKLCGHEWGLFGREDPD